MLKASPINKLDDLSGKTVGVDTASTGDIWATENTGKYKIAKISRYEGLAPAMLDLAAGRIDGYISDIPAVEYYIKDKPQYRVVEPHPDRRALLVHVRQELRRSPPRSTTR